MRPPWLVEQQDLALSILGSLVEHLTFLASKSPRVWFLLLAIGFYWMLTLNLLQILERMWNFIIGTLLPISPSHVLQLLQVELLGMSWKLLPITDTLIAQVRNHMWVIMSITAYQICVFIADCDNAKPSSFRASIFFLHLKLSDVLWLG
jgi:hypothetical protein